VDFQRRRKWQEGQKDEHDTNGDRSSGPLDHASVHLDLTHNGVGTYHAFCLVTSTVLLRGATARVPDSLHKIGRRPTLHRTTGRESARMVTG
jgi:hypothetical protein